MEDLRRRASRRVQAYEWRIAIMGQSSAAGFGDFGKWVPGFDFLQSLTQPAQASAGAAPALGGWVAPTLSVEDLDKRIAELKAVLFWLEQNGTALKATIQALEVQKMTLVALKGMNVSLQDMAQAFSVKAPAAPSAASTASAPAQTPVEPPAAEPPAKPRRRAAKARAASPANAAAAAPGPVDPMQWWGALTQQFQQIAQAAVADAQSRKSTDAPAQTGAASPAPKPARKGQAAKPRKAL
jgi:pyruvate/2-oxoglutarate dehydrogenase complex dihydrolipoamide acyltransferase (E2) component